MDKCTDCGACDAICPELHINELRDNQGEERRLSNDLIDRLRKQISLDDLDEDDKARISNIKKNILTSEEELAVLNNIKFEFEKEVRKFEAEVGPVKYVAEVLYSDVDENVLVLLLSLKLISKKI